MGELLLYVAGAVIVSAVLFALAVFVLPAGTQIAPAPRDELPFASLPEGPISAEDIARTRLPVALRGYRFAETDALIERLASEIAERDAELARLRPERPDS